MQQKSKERDKLRLKCQNCGYVWDYGGNRRFYASCPDCTYRVNIEKQQVDEKD